MKLVTVQFDDAVDISLLPVGATPVSVSDGTNTLADGTIFALSEVKNPELVSHTHVLPDVNLARESGPPVVP